MSNHNHERRLQEAIVTKAKWENIVATNQLYLCPNCCIEKPADAFVIQYMNNQLVGKYRYLYECKQCKRERIYAKRADKRKTIAGACDIIIKHVYQGAKKRNLEFAIDKKYLLELREKQQGRCYYSGLEMKFAFVGYKIGSWTQKAKMQVSCDRKDNDIGYTKENTVLCCTFINKMKGNLDEQEFYETCFLIVKKNK